MLRIGASPADTRDFENEDIFISRLKLLIIMSSAYLNDYPLGDFRKKAILRNANLVAREIVDWQGQVNNFRSDYELKGDLDFDHVFFQRVKLLAVMAKAFAEDHPMGYHRLKALEDNLNHICEVITFNRQLYGKEFFKVA
jgi:hypothetical protein